MLVLLVGCGGTEPARMPAQSSDSAPCACSGADPLRPCAGEDVSATCRECLKDGGALCHEGTWLRACAAGCASCIDAFDLPNGDACYIDSDTCEEFFDEDCRAARADTRECFTWVGTACTGKL